MRVGGVDRLELLHEVVVDVESARGVQDDDVELLGLPAMNAPPTDPDRRTDGLAVLVALLRLAMEGDHAVARRLGRHALGRRRSCSTAAGRWRSAATTRPAYPA